MDIRPINERLMLEPSRRFVQIIDVVSDCNFAFLYVENPEAFNALRQKYRELSEANRKAEDTDKGDRELMHAIGEFFELLGSTFKAM